MPNINGPKIEGVNFKMFAAGEAAQPSEYGELATFARGSGFAGPIKSLIRHLGIHRRCLRQAGAQADCRFRSPPRLRGGDSHSRARVRRSGSPAKYFCRAFAKISLSVAMRANRVMEE